MKSFFPYGERHGEESQEGKEGNKKEESQEEVVLEPTYFSFVDCGRREQSITLRGDFAKVQLGLTQLALQFWPGFLVEASFGEVMLP